MNKQKTTTKTLPAKVQIYIDIDQGKGPTGLAAPSGSLVLVLPHYLYQLDFTVFYMDILFQEVPIVNSHRQQNEKV